MRYLPHLLTGSRFLWSAGLLLFPTDSLPFWGLYLLCGASDILDGWLARRLHAESAFGARLDSAADLCFTLALLARFLPLLRGRGVLWACCGVVCLLRLAAAVTVTPPLWPLGLLSHAVQQSNRRLAVPLPAPLCPIRRCPLPASPRSGRPPFRG